MMKKRELGDACRACLQLKHTVKDFASNVLHKSGF